MRKFLLTITIGALICGCTKSTPPDSNKIILARVGDEVVNLKDFARAFRPYLNHEGSFEEQKVSVLQQLITDKLIINEANKNGIMVTSSELMTHVQKIKNGLTYAQWKEVLKSSGVHEYEWQEEQQKSLRVQKTIKNLISKKVKVKEKESKAYYDSHPNQNRRAAERRIRHILLSTEDEANQVRDRLLKGESFSELAKKHSISPDAEKGGDMGYLAKDELIPAYSSAWGMRSGEISEVIKTNYGFHIFKALGKRKSKILSYWGRRDEIRAQLRMDKERKAYKELLSKLYENEKIYTYPDVIAGISPELLASLSL